MKVIVQAYGDDMVVCFPCEVAERYGIKSDSEVEITEKTNGILI